jgi:hypothetical protein
MDETYRMLGRELEADLKRDADRWRLAAEVRRQRRASGLAPNLDRRPKSRSVMRVLIAALLVHGVPADD